MFWYLLVFAVLVGLASLESGKIFGWAGLAAAAILIVIGGLRYETGFDWVEYENYLYFSPELGASNIYVNADTFTAEPGFAALNVLFQTFGLGFQTLLFTIALFNISILYGFVKKFTPAVAAVLLWYYGNLFLTGQMATIRQALSVTFIYLAIMAASDRRVAWAVLWSIAAVAFHSFSAFFVPILFIRRPSPRTSTVIALAFVGFVISLGGTDLFRLFANNVLTYVDGGIVSSKIALYAEFEGARISPFALLLLVWNLVFIWAGGRSIMRGVLERDYIVNFSLWMTAVSVLAHTYFATFPIVWNRLMLVTFVVQAIVYSRIVLGGRAPIRSAGAFVAATAGISLLALCFTLLGPQSMVFKPYQSMIVVWARGPYGDGRLRYQIIRRENDQIVAETKI